MIFQLCLLLLITYPTAFCAVGGLIGRVQSTGVRGIDMDDFMGETKSDSQGNFEVSGYIHEMSPIDPKINIYHDCNDSWKPCQRKISIMIPDGYITEAKSPRKWYNAGTIELAGKFSGESRDCIH
uniref:Transthyretin/hydroxyisourate hydrolase domain-containing protein n=1 Tax=Setaria digitata TaxID=48799 RepID=A0A915Q040_9BILA